MNRQKFTRREIFAPTGTAITAAMIGGLSNASHAAPRQDKPSNKQAFRYCLNTGTIRGQKLGLLKEIEVVAKAGYDAIEPWIDSIRNYEKQGGSLKDLKKKISDLGLTVESAIGFSQWVVDDDAKRAKGMENIKQDMDILAQIGGKRIAAPPAGATNQPGLDLLKAAERYRELLDLGDQMGVVAQIETWGPSKNLYRLGQAAYVAIESGHPKACILADVYHLYKGGSDFNGLKLLRGSAMQVFHMNDYPADPPRESIGDKDRVYPGDGIAPLTQILRDLFATGPGKILSLEIFNRTYWAQDALKTATDGLRKMKDAVHKALG